MNSLLAKQGLTSEQLLMVNAEVERNSKSKTVAYLLWFFLGGFGVHRFYAGDVGYGIGMLVTTLILMFLPPLFILWPLIDVFFIGKRIERHNNKVEMQAISEVKLYTAARKEQEQLETV